MMARVFAILALLLAAAAASAAPYPLSCTYTARAANAELEPHAACAERVGHTLRIAPRHLALMSFAKMGLAEVLVADAWYYVQKNGDSLQVLTFDNGADYFSEGLTRSLVDGKIAYFDSRFQQIVGPKYDWGGPFENGRALVCVGCKASALDEDGHRGFEGGRWGYIDKNGVEVVPVGLTEREAEAR